MALCAAQVIPRGISRSLSGYDPGMKLSQMQIALGRSPDAVPHLGPTRLLISGCGGEFLRQRSEDAGTQFVPFDIRSDYPEYVDGKPRIEGTESFLQSRGIDLPEGSESDSSSAATVHGLSKRKNDLLQQLIGRDGVDIYPRSVRYVRRLRASGMRCAVVSSSANARSVLHAVGIMELFDGCVDGHDAERADLAGKPAPDTYLAGARLLHLPAADVAIFDDALAGVEAGRNGGFGFVVGVDRSGHGNELHTHGADVVVSDLGELLAEND
jgi:HAD superfamily hydrolase (TIGR01509 family)